MGRLLRGILGGLAFLVLVAAAAASPAQALDPTRLVLQQADTSGQTPWKTQTSAQLTADDGSAAASAKFKRVSGAVSSYQAPGLIGGLPLFLTSRAVVFRDAAGAHGAFLEVASKIDTSPLHPRGSTLAIGQEGRFWEQSVIGIRDRSYSVLWRQGNVLALVQASGEPVILKTEIVTLPQRQQARIAALVPAAEPGPPLIIKPVIGRPVAQPAQPRAGKRFALVFRLTHSDDGSPLVNATVKTAVRLAGKVTQHQYSFAAGQLKVSLTIPRAAKGNQLKVTTVVRSDGQSATKIVTYRVR
jgi:hypothetical protein